MKILCILLALALSLPVLGSLKESELNGLKAKVIDIEKTATLLSINGKTPTFACYPIDEPPAVSKEDIAHISKQITADGSFRDVDYKNKDRSEWKTQKHLNYCRMLAIALHTHPDNILKQYKVRENCLKALDWWLKNNPKNPNWWSNDVYAPHMLGNVAILIGKESLTEERASRLNEITISIKPSRTGQNQMWLSWNSMLLGLALNDGQRIEQAMDSLAKTIHVSSPGKEGIQIDMSFQQHGPQLYQGNYGRHYLHSASKFLRAAKGTKWEDQEKTAIFEKLLLDGTRWMCHGNLLDYSVWGRQISYADRLQGPDIVFPCMHLLACSPSREVEISQFANSLRGQKPSNSLTGTKAYPVSDYIAHRGQDYLTTVRMSSSRTIIGETTNSENLKGCYLSDGAMLTYKTGREYDSIFPCWDWSCIPGTTAQRGYLPSKWSDQRGGSPFAGAMDHGVAAMQVNHFGLKANKSWFFFPDRIICMGSGINQTGNTGQEGNIVTTIEQNLYTGSKPSEAKGRKAKGILYGNSLYLISSENKSVIETDKRKGNWKSLRINQSDEEIEKPVFLLLIDHGTNVENGKYSYQVFPTKPSMSSIDKLWDEIAVIAHDENVHAIKHGELVKAVFFSPASLKLPDGTTIEPSEPCLLAIPQKGAVHISIPGKTSGKTTVTLNGKKTEIMLENAAR